MFAAHSRYGNEAEQLFHAGVSHFSTGTYKAPWLTRCMKHWVADGEYRAECVLCDSTQKAATFLLASWHVYQPNVVNGAVCGATNQEERRDTGLPCETFSEKRKKRRRVLQMCVSIEKESTQNSMEIVTVKLSYREVGATRKCTSSWW